MLRQRLQSNHRNRPRCTNAPHQKPPTPRWAYQPTSRRCIRRTRRRLRHHPPRRHNQPFHRRTGPPHHPALPMPLHPSQDTKHTQHRGRRSRRRHPPHDGLDRRHRTTRPRSMGTRHHPLRLANPPLPRTRVALQRGLQARRIPNASHRR